jgi:gluconolactonase
MWQPSDRYPDPAVQVIDASFNRYRLPLASVERLFTGCRWSEGPVYFGDGRYVLWSDIPNDRILKWEEETGAVSVFRKSQQRQRQYARPPGPAGHLRASRPPRDPHRV